MYWYYLRSPKRLVKSKVIILGKDLGILEKCCLKNERHPKFKGKMQCKLQKFKNYKRMNQRSDGQKSFRIALLVKQKQLLVF